MVFVGELPRNPTGKVLKRELPRRARSGRGRREPGDRALAWSLATSDDFDLAGLRLSAGEGRRLELEVPVEPLEPAASATSRAAAGAGAGSTSHV